MNRLIAFHPQKIAGARSGDDSGPEILQLSQTRPVKMIHMRVRKQDKIRDRQFQSESRRDVTSRFRPTV